MAKKPEYDMTPLQVAQVASDRHQVFNAWAASVASTIVTSSLGEKLLEKMQKNNALELARLENAIAQHIVVCSKKPDSFLHAVPDEQKLAAINYNIDESHGDSSWVNDVDRQGGSFTDAEINASREWK